MTGTGIVDRAYLTDNLSDFFWTDSPSCINFAPTASSQNAKVLDDQ